jgi:anti-sigma factor RsiW
MMTCDEYFENTVENEGDLDPATKAACEEHLRTCDECSRLKDGVEAYDDAMRNPGKYPGSSPELKAKILAAAKAAIEDRKGPPPSEKPRAASPPKPEPDGSGRRLLGFFVVGTLVLGVGVFVGRVTAPPYAGWTPLPTSLVKVHLEAARELRRLGFEDEAKAHEKAAHDIDDPPGSNLLSPPK